VLVFSGGSRRFSWAPVGFFAGGANPGATSLFKGISVYCLLVEHQQLLMYFTP